MAVNVKPAEDWNGASGRHFIEQRRQRRQREQRERHERMRGRLTAQLLAAEVQLSAEVVARLDAVGTPAGDL